MEAIIGAERKTNLARMASGEDRMRKKIILQLIANDSFMNKKNKLIGIFLIFLLIFSVIFQTSPIIDSMQSFFSSKEETQESHGASWENEYGKLEVWPDTSTNIIRQTQYCNLTSYIADTDIDVAFRFDEPVGNPNIWLWANISHDVRVFDYENIIVNYTLYNISNIETINESVANESGLDFGDIPSDYYRVGNASFWDGIEWRNDIFVIGFDSVEWFNPDNHSEGANFTFEYWGATDYHIEQQYWFDWKSIKDKFNHISRPSGEYYYVTEWLIKDKLYQFKWQYDIPIHSSGKWDLLAKKSLDPIGTWRVQIDPWWNSNWDHYRTITIDSDYIDAALTGFPILVVIDNSTFHIGTNSSIRFVSTDNTTEFNYEIELWDDTGDCFVWVNISEAIPSGSDYSFLMYYNNTAASDNQNPEGVWDNNYIAVMHMNDFNATTLLNSADNNNATKVSTPIEATGHIGYAQDFEEDDGDYARFASSLSLDYTIADKVTIEMWIKREQTGNRDTVFHDWIGPANAQQSLMFMVHTTNKIYMRICSGAADKNLESILLVGAGWTHISATYDFADGFQRVFLNGSATGTSDVGSLNLNSGAWNSDMAQFSAGAFRTDGLIDEFRISDIARNESWLKASFHTANQTPGFITFGAEQDQAAPPPVNEGPVQAYPFPGNNTGCTNTSVRFYINITDPEGDYMNATWYSNSSGSWLPFGWNSSILNGTYSQVGTNFTACNTTYYVNISINDSGESNWSNVTYHFTMACCPSIYLIYPLNESTNIPRTPTIRVQANDSCGLPLNIYWFQNSTGYWTHNQSNMSAAANSTIYWTYENATNYSTTYYFNVSVNNTYCNVTYIFHFTTIVSSPPNAPTSPECDNQTNPGHVLDHTPYFDWVFSDPDGGDTQGGFHIQIGNDTDWGTVERWDSNQSSNTNNYTTYAGLTLYDGDTYYWRVKTKDDKSVWGPWTTNQNFRMNTKPTAPILNSPANNTNHLPFTTESVNLTWFASTDNESDSINYEWSYAKDSAFSVGEMHGWSGGPTYEKIPAAGTLDMNTWYYWRITAWDGLEYGNESVWRRFHTDDDPCSLSNENPANQTIDVSILTSIWNITIEDPEGDLFNWTIELSNGNNSLCNEDSNGSKICYINVTTSITYNVWVNTTNNGSMIWNNKTYWFTTEGLNVITPFPINESTGVARPPANISTFINGTNVNITYNYYNMTPWPNTTQLLYNWSNCNSNRYEVINLGAAANWSNSFIWGNTIYYWWVNITNGTTWVNRSYEYTTTGSRYDVTNSGDVISGDVSADWANRQGVEPYDGIYDVDSSGDIISSDLSLIWTNRT